MAEEIITALSRIRWLFVIARNLSFAYKGQVIDVKRVGRELGVRYVLEGSVRRAGERVRITTQLIEAMTGGHLWADRFDGSYRRCLRSSGQGGLQRRGSHRAGVAGSRDRMFTQPFNERTQRLSRPICAAIRCFSRWQSRSRRRLLCWKRRSDAIRIMVRRLAFAAHCCMRLCMDGSTKHPESDRRKGIDYARRALRLAGDDPGTLANSAMALAFFGEDIGAMIALVDRALMLNPSFARGWHISSMLRNWSGQPNLAIEHAEIALQLSPRGGIGSPFLMIGISHLLSRRFDEALAALLLATQDLPSDFPDPYRLLVACYAHMGRLDDAREVLQRLRGMTPLVFGDYLHFRNSEHRELLVSGLHSAAGRTGWRSVHYFQQDDPGGDKQANSLPSRASGVLALTMRLHAHKLAAQDGSWAPPPVQKQSPT